MPSYREGLSHSLLTALAHGRPIIATDVQSCREVVQNNFNGYLCEAKNYKNLEEKIIKFYYLNNEEKKLWVRIVEFLLINLILIKLIIFIKNI